MNVLELAVGLWRWSTPHPDWTEAEEWPREVGSVYYEAPAATVLFDPLVPAGADRGRFFEALDRDVERRGVPVAVLLTVAWHERSAAELVERYAATDQAPAGVEAFGVPEVDETLWWLPEHGALVAGDVLLGVEDGIQVCPDSWLDDRSSHASIRGALAPLLELPLERILVSHGEPVLGRGRAALEQALSA